MKRYRKASHRVITPALLLSISLLLNPVASFGKAAGGEVKDDSPTIHDLASRDDLEGLKELLAPLIDGGGGEGAREAGEDLLALIDKRDGRGMTPLMAAAVNGAFGTGELLIRHGADINATFSDGATALFMAVYGTNTKLVKLLLEKGADYKVTVKGLPMLHLAVERGDEFIVGLLVLSGADLNERSSTGYLPLDLSVRSKGVAAILIDGGADLEGTEETLRKRPVLGSVLVPFLEWAHSYSIGKKGVAGRYLIRGVRPSGSKRGSVTILGSPSGGVNSGGPGEGAEEDEGAEEEKVRWGVAVGEYKGDALPAEDPHKEVTAGKERGGDGGKSATEIPLGDGSIHRYSGRVTIIQGLGLNSTGGRYNRLTFLLTGELGYVYLRGEGEVVDFRSGEVVRLGY